MHLSEGLLSTKQSLFWIGTSSPFLFFGFRKLKSFLETETVRNKALLQMFTALLFALTMFPIPVPIIGVTSHMCMTPLFAIVLGPLITIIPAFIVLLLQAALLAHGGISTIGANVFTLGIIGPFVSCFLFLLLKKLPRQSLAVFISVGFGSLCVYIVDALILSSALAGKETFSYWFSKVVIAIAPIQIPVSLLEAALAVFIIRGLQDRQIIDIFKNKISVAAIVFAFAILLPNISSAQAVDNGLDKIVFEKIAVNAGVIPSAPIWTPAREITESLILLVTILSGIVIGLNWAKITKTAH